MLIIQSNWFEEALHDLEADMTQVSFLITPERPYFRVSVQGMLGTTEV